MNIISRKKIKEENQGIATILAFALIPLSGFATDIYIPSMPSMENVLNVTSLQVQLTLSMFLISYGISQLFIGTVVDSYGRYNIGLLSLFLFAVSCIAIAATQNIYLIYLMRIVQGLTVAGIVVAKRAYFVDVYSGDKLKHYLSIFTIIWSTGPIIAPFIGGYLQKFFGWQSNFYFLAGFAIVILVFEMIFSGETHRNPSPFRIKTIARVYKKMISTTSFSLGLLMLAFAYSMVMLYNMKGSFIIEHEYKMSPIVSGYCSLLLGFAWMIGGFIGKATINRPFYSRMLTNVFAQLMVAVLMVIVSIYLSNIYTLLVFAFLIHVGAGYTYNNYFSYSLTRFPENAGIAGGLTGGSVYIFVSLLTYVVIGILPGKDQLNLSWGYGLFVIASFVLMLLLQRKFGVPQNPAKI